MKKIIIAAFAMLFSTALFAQTDTPADKKASAEMELKKDCVMMKDGKMMVKKDGVTSLMLTDMTLSNGTTIKTDGSVVTSDGKTSMLMEGEGYYMDGTMKPTKNKSKSKS